jgi:hypothetical protein
LDDWSKYITYAERCLAIARTLGSRENRVVLREMAAEWTHVANALDSSERREELAGQAVAYGAGPSSETSVPG